MNISSVVTAYSGGAGSTARPTAPTRPSVQPAADAPRVTTNEPSAERVSQAVKQVNEAFADKGQNLVASIEKDKATGINVVKISDKETNELVSQYPSKTMVAIAESLSQYQSKKGQMLNVSA